jgi:hypothetical protein
MAIDPQKEGVFRHQEERLSRSQRLRSSGVRTLGIVVAKQRRIGQGSLLMNVNHRQSRLSSSCPGMAESGVDFCKRMTFGEYRSVYECCVIALTVGQRCRAWEFSWSCTLRDCFCLGNPATMGGNCVNPFCNAQAHNN